MRKSKKTDYESPDTSVFKIDYQSICATSRAVEPTAPEDWDEGNLDWWNS